MSVDAEREVHEANTAAWIDAEPVSIVLSRTVREPDGAGGFKPGTKTTISAQTFRMDRSTLATLRLVTSEDGTRVPDSFRIVGPPGSDVEPGDEFTVNGQRFVVIIVSSERYRRVAAEVEYRG